MIAHVLTWLVCGWVAVAICSRITPRRVAATLVVAGAGALLILFVL